MKRWTLPYNPYCSERCPERELLRVILKLPNRLWERRWTLPCIPHCSERWPEGELLALTPQKPKWIAWNDLWNLLKKIKQKFFYRVVAKIRSYWYMQIGIVLRNNKGFTSSRSNFCLKTINWFNVTAALKWENNKESFNNGYHLIEFLFCLPLHNLRRLNLWP